MATFVREYFSPPGKISAILDFEYAMQAPKTMSLVMEEFCLYPNDYAEEETKFSVRLISRVSSSSCVSTIPSYLRSRIYEKGWIYTTCKPRWAATLPGGRPTCAPSLLIAWHLRSSTWRGSPILPFVTV
jgi:hypothetical protein